MEKFLKIGGIAVMIVIAIPIIRATLGAPFVPTPRKTMRKMLANTNLQKGQIVYDLGCGDGRLVRLASREYGVKTIGIELNPLAYLYAKIRSLGYENETILYGNLLQINLSQADVIFCYLMPKLMQKMEQKLAKELKSDATIISHCFRFKTWQPQKILMPPKGDYGKIFVYRKRGN